ncbi:MAG: hypothetical protein GY898_32750 [Proteobacteria bacterium]|nr:hypothetical protein [Pseudomonadota bacterium]
MVKVRTNVLTPVGTVACLTAPALPLTSCDPSLIDGSRGEPVLSSTATWSALGGQLEAEFAQQVRSAGDVNADGYDDVLVGSASRTSPSAPPTRTTSATCTSSWGAPRGSARTRTGRRRAPASPAWSSARRSYGPATSTPTATTIC